MTDEEYKRLSLKELYGHRPVGKNDTDRKEKEAGWGTLCRRRL